MSINRPTYPRIDEPDSRKVSHYLPAIPPKSPLSGRGHSLIRFHHLARADPDTTVIGVVSKPPGARALAKLLERAGRSSKPVAACFLGIDHLPEHAPHIHLTRTIDEAAVQAALLTGGGDIALNAVPNDQWRQWLDRETALMLPEQKYIRGLFAGGTFCYQAQYVLRTLGFNVYSDSPISGMRQLVDALRSVSHTLVDREQSFSPMDDHTR